MIYWIKNILHKVGFNTIAKGDQEELYRNEVPMVVSVIDEFPDPTKDELTLPCVSVEHERTSEEGLQIGGGFNERRTFNINIFARRDGERDDLAEAIYEGLDGEVKVLDYNIAMPTYVYSSGEGILTEYYGGDVPTPLSDLLVDNKQIETVPRLGPSEWDKHRALIRVTTRDIR